MTNITTISIFATLIIKFLLGILLPPFIVALIIHLTIAKKYKKKKRWTISVISFLIAFLIWFLFIKWLVNLFR